MRRKAPGMLQVRAELATPTNTPPRAAMVFKKSKEFDSEEEEAARAGARPKSLFSDQHFSDMST